MLICNYKARFVFKGDATKELSPEVENNFQNLVKQTAQGLSKMMVPDYRDIEMHPAA